jgi:hypothetical protein
MGGGIKDEKDNRNFDLYAVDFHCFSCDRGIWKK